MFYLDLGGGQSLPVILNRYMLLNLENGPQTVDSRSSSPLDDLYMHHLARKGI